MELYDTDMQFGLHIRQRGIDDGVVEEGQEEEASNTASPKCARNGCTADSARPSRVEAALWGVGAGVISFVRALRLVDAARLATLSTLHTFVDGTGRKCPHPL